MIPVIQKVEKTGNVIKTDTKSHNQALLIIFENLAMFNILPFPS